MSKQRIAWIDGVKGLACMIVFWEHIYYTFLGNSPVIMGQIHEGVPSFFKIANILVNGNFGVCLFVMLSGYLASVKQINSIGELGKAVLLRYLKFIAAFAAVFVLYQVILGTIGFQTQMWGQEYESAWVAMHYSNKLTWLECIREVFLLGFGMNAPLWTIMPIFLSNVLVFAVNYLMKNKTRKIKVVIALLLVVTGFVLGYPGRDACSKIILYTGYSFVGMLLPYLWKFFSKWKEWILWILLICAVIGVNGGYRYVVSYASMVVHVPEVFYSQIYWNAILAIAIVSFIGGMAGLCKGLSKPFFQIINQYSFPVYLFHFPIFCSVGLWLHDMLSSKLNQTMTFFLMVAIIHLLVFALAWLYNATWDKWSNRLLKKI